MKKFAKLLVLALVVAALAAIFAIPSAAAEGPVLYVSNTGTGDGKTPQTPMGHSEGYVPDDSTQYKGNVLIQAFYKLGATGGTIVVVGPTSLDTASTNTNVSGKTAAELDCITYEGRNSDYNANPTITITSNYGGVDYRTQGAKIILDHAECCSGNLRLKSPTIWKDIVLEYKYDPTWLSYYNTTSEGIIAPYMIYADYCKMVIDTGVECKSVKVETAADGTKTEVESDIYPALLGGHRQSVREGNTDLTVKSGTWTFVGAAGYGHAQDATKNATVKGNAKLTIEGGKIGQIYGTGSIPRAFGTVTGTVDITIKGGEVGDIWLTNGEPYTGPGITCTVTDPAKITGTINHSPIEGEVLPECVVTVNGQPYVPQVAETTAPETDPPIINNGNNSNGKPATKVPATTTAPATTDDKKEESGNTTLIIIIVVVAVVVIAAAVVVLLLIKKKKAAK